MHRRLWRPRRSLLKLIEKLIEHITPLPTGEGPGVGLFIVSYTESSEARRQSSRCLPAEVSSQSA